MKNLFLTILCLPFFIHQAIASDAAIILLKGQVTVNSKPATKGMSIQIGDKIEANGEKSFVQIQFNSGSKVMLRDGSMVLQKFNAKETELSLLKGAVFSYVNKKAKKEFVIKSQNVSMAVRGTKFVVTSSPGDTYLCVCEGVVEIKNNTGKLNVKAKEDIHATSKSQLKIASASDMMWSMAKEGFDLMKEPVK